MNLIGGKSLQIASLNMNIFSFLQICVSGSSDIQEDHSEKQCQEEEAVRGIHRNITTAYVIRG